jgi:polysaccharide export outer membrane protein
VNLLAMSLHQLSGLMKHLLASATFAALVCQGLVPLAAQPLQAPAAAATATAGTRSAAAESQPGSDFVIGVGDVLSIVFWRDEKLSREVLVRPDGMISLPLLNDVPAAGYTPDKLAVALSRAALKYVTEPDVTVIVTGIHSRQIFVVGEVLKPGAVALTGDMTVLQAIGVAGGLQEYADKKNIVIIRSERGLEKRLKFNYEQVLKGRNPQQNIVLRPGDTIVVP